MSPLVERALERAGLLAFARARLAGDATPSHVKAVEDRLLAADLLALGALADAVRAHAVGDLVRIHADHDPAVAWVRGGPRAHARAGLSLLRQVAILRIELPDAARVGVNYNELGLELAQVALGFGASELGGQLANKRGLPIADDASKRVKGRGQVSAQQLQREELATMLGYVGRRVVFEAEGRASETLDETLRGASHA